MEKVDIIVIGAGAGGLTIASFMNKAGFRVLLIDKSDKSIGGDCLNAGCVPSKALIHVAKLTAHANEARAFGIKTSGNVNFSKVKSYIQEKQGVFRKHENAEYLKNKGIMVELGTARFTAKSVVEVNNKTYSAKRIVVATGSRPRIPSIKGINEVQELHTNESIFTLKKLPSRLLVIGGGPIGIELSQAFSRLGSKVTVIQHGSTILSREDPEISSIILEKLRQEGVTVCCNAKPLYFKGKQMLVIKEENGNERNISFDAVLLATGREVNIPAGVEAAGIKLSGDKSKIFVNKYLQTSNKRVFLCGDVAGMHQFTHAAELHAGLILRNFFSPFKKSLNADHLSWVTYTDPEIATFGMSEVELKQRGISFQKITQDFSKIDRAITDNAKGMLILFIQKNKILGGTLIAPNAGEIIQELILANAAGLSIKYFFNKIYPYPTASRVNKAAITQLFEGKLTPFTKKVLKWLY